MAGGASKRTAAINSTTPDPIRPQGSSPRVEKIYTDSFAPVNLKNNVCSKITAAIPRSNQLVMRNAFECSILPFLKIKKLRCLGPAQITVEEFWLGLGQVHQDQTVQSVRKLGIHIESEQL